MIRPWDAPRDDDAAAMVVVGCRRRIRRGLPWALAVLVTTCLLLWSKNDDPTAAALVDPAEDDDWVSLRYNDASLYWKEYFVHEKSYVLQVCSYITKKRFKTRVYQNKFLVALKSSAERGLYFF